MLAYFFDLDGTLINSGADLAYAMNLTRVEYGMEKLPEETIIGTVGNGLRKMVERSIPERPDIVDELLAAHMRNYSEHCLDRTYLYPGAKETLKKLFDLGCPLAVATNKPGNLSRKILKGLGVLPYFGAVVGDGDSEKLKPEPDPIFTAARLMGHTLTPDDWMVGDNYTDLAAGRKAGIRRCLCLFGLGHQKDEKYDASVQHFEEILSLPDTRENRG